MRQARLLFWLMSGLILLSACNVNQAGEPTLPPTYVYEEFLATCNVFPGVDFEQYSVLGNQATATGCTVAFEKYVYRDDQSKRR